MRRGDGVILVTEPDSILPAARPCTPLRSAIDTAHRTAPTPDEILFSSLLRPPARVAPRRMLCTTRLHSTRRATVHAPPLRHRHRSPHSTDTRRDIIFLVSPTPCAGSAAPHAVHDQESTVPLLLLPYFTWTVSTKLKVTK